MQPVGGKVPQFSLKPHPAAVWLLVLTLLVGGLLGLALLSKEEGVGDYRMRAILVFSTTGILVFCQLIAMTSRLWFAHLWKRNSTHARHHQHSPNHPAMREKMYREQRQRELQRTQPKRRRRKF